MINRNIIKTCLYPFKNNKYYKKKTHFYNRKENKLLK